MEDLPGSMIADLSLMRAKARDSELNNYGITVPINMFFLSMFVPVETLIVPVLSLLVPFLSLIFSVLFLLFSVL